MAIVRTNIGTNPDGSPLYHYASDGHVVITGPITGEVTLKDGSVVDVTPEVVEVASEKQAAEVAHLVGQRYEAEGHPKHTDGTAFVYEPDSKKG